MEDLRSFSQFCLASEAIVDIAIINYCNAFIAPISSAVGIGRNLLLPRFLDDAGIDFEKTRDGSIHEKSFADGSHAFHHSQRRGAL